MQHPLCGMLQPLCEEREGRQRTKKGNEDKRRRKGTKIGNIDGEPGQGTKTKNQDYEPRLRTENIEQEKTKKEIIKRNNDLPDFRNK